MSEANAAEVWNVFVTAATGVAVGLLAWQANQLGKSANKIAADAQERAERAEAREGRILLIHLQPEIDSVLKAARELFDMESNIIASGLYAVGVDNRRAMHQALAGMALSSITHNMARLHTLPFPADDAVAKATGLHRLALTQATLGLNAWHHITGEELSAMHGVIHRAVGQMVEALEVASKTAREVLK